MTAGLSHLQIDDLSVAYRQAGHGPALVLLHGFLGDSRCWRRQMADLADQFNVIAWDAPGAGGSSDPSDSFSLTDWTRCLAKFLDALRVDQVHLVGLSWGGVLAQDYARLFPKRVSRLILAGSYAGWKGSLPAAVVEQRLARCEHDSCLSPDEFAPRWAAEMFTNAVPPEVLEEMAALIGEFHPRGFRLMARAVASTDTTPLLSQITSRTLLLWGAEDQRSPISIAKQLSDAISGAELAIIAHAGHVLNMEQAAAFNAHVRRFCLSE